MKNTALTETHKALGAKIVPFAGYNMPVQYEGVNIEHETVRNAVGVFDVSVQMVHSLKWNAKFNEALIIFNVLWCDVCRRGCQYHMLLSIVFLKSNQYRQGEFWSILPA